MFIFAHLRKCAGSSVVQAAVRAGLRLPQGHVNGALPNASGHALGGFDTMPFADLDRLLRPLVADGVDFVAIEWDFPRFERFPDNLGLQFFTIFRDPVERLVSNYTYDVVSGYTKAATIEDYMEREDIWTRADYFTRFFNGLSATTTVGNAHVDYAFEVVSRHFRFACFGEDLHGFLVREVGLPVGALPRVNRTSVIRRVLHRASLTVSDDDKARLRRLNSHDYLLYDRLKSLRDQQRLQSSGR